jgi:hypothetical protein
MPNRHVPALNPELVPPVFGTGLKIFVSIAMFALDILSLLKHGRFCYHRGMLAVASLTLSPAKVDVPTL